MVGSVQISERETAPTLTALSVPPIETEVKRKKMAFWHRLVKFSSMR